MDFGLLEAAGEIATLPLRHKAARVWFGISGELNLAHHLTEEVGAPDVEFQLVHDVGFYVCAGVLEVDGIDPCVEGGEDLLRRGDVRFRCAFLRSFDEVREIKRHALRDVPGHIVPVTPLYPVLPLAEERGRLTDIRPKGDTFYYFDGLDCEHPVF